MSAFRGWAIRHVDLASAPAAWGVEGEGDGVLVVFWHGDVPLGRAWVERGELPLAPAQAAQLAARTVAPAVGFWCLGSAFTPPLPNADDLTARRRTVPDRDALAGLLAPLRAVAQVAGAAAGAHDTRRPTLTVVICTRGRPEPLSRCLAALAASADPADEVVVVDNAPDDDATLRVVERHPRVRYVCEPVAGLSRARNTGIRESGGEIVAFTDDDVEVHLGWTARIRSALADATHAAVTGLVLPASLASEPEYLFEAKFGGFSQGFRPIVFDRDFREATLTWAPPVWRIGAGANMAFRREALARVGDFDERLGAGRAGCSEDSELWYRLLAAGMSCLYEPRAVVFHRHRGDMASLRRQMRAYTRGHVVALLVQFERTGDWGNLRRLFLSLPKYYLWRLGRRLTSVSPPSPTTYVEEVSGVLAGLAYYLRAGASRRGTT